MWSAHLQGPLPAVAVVLRHTFYQRKFAVLDSAADWQNPVATSRRVAGGLEYMPAFLSDYAACRIPLCARVKQVAQPANAGRSARISYNVGCDLSFSVSGSRTGPDGCTTGKPNPVAS